MKIKWIRLLFLSILISTSARAEQNTQKERGKPMEKAIFAAGCFWGVEALFEDVKGVTDVTSGYTGGTTQNPTYREVCSKLTGHAEAVEVTFDPSIVSYEFLLDIFWRLHDPTTVNRQGPDVGSQYRSAIFYLNEDQKAAAERVKPTAQKRWKQPIVTEITKATTFYPAEEYHQNYFKKHGGHGCHYLRN